MADIRPFRGLRYDQSLTPDLGCVLSPPYDVIDAEDGRRLRERHPYNVVRLELTAASAVSGPEERYDEAARTLRAWREQGILRTEDTPSFYLHEVDFTYPGGGATRRELIAAVRLEPWDRRIVLPHERTFPRAKADRLRLLTATRANLSPILAFYQRGHGATTADPLAEAWDWAAHRAPDASGTDADGAQHRLWVLADGPLAARIHAYFAERPAFIADGHHRYETALTYLEQRRKEAGGELAPDDPARFVMMHLIAEDDPGLVILPLHRLVSGVGRDAFAGLLDRLRDRVDVEPGPDLSQSDADAVGRLMQGVRKRGERGQAVALYGPERESVWLVSRVRSAELPSEIPACHDPSWQALDVVFVDNVIVRPLLAELGRSAEAALAYSRDAHDAIARVNAGDADLAVLVNPTRVEQVAAVALADERMPEKSTYFYPKAPTGLVLRPLE
ncbi:MAG: DUF1015 domain-containing protein [Chloroflexi bacterium]|nr:DUF1015 domain-containing protein [Chloroflexota bacterium]